MFFSTEARDFLHHLANIINVRYKVTDIVFIVFVYFSVFIMYNKFSNLVLSNLYLCLVLTIFFFYSIKYVTQDLNPIRYIRLYIPDVYVIIGDFVNEIRNDNLKENQVKIKQEAIIDECISCIRYTQSVEVVHLLGMFALIFLFFPVATLGYYSANNDIHYRDIIDHFYFNIVMITTIGTEPSWQTKVLPNSGDSYYYEFVFIQASVGILYTVGYVSLFVTNIISLKPQVFREELRKYFLMLYNTYKVGLS